MALDEYLIQAHDKRMQEEAWKALYEANLCSAVEIWKPGFGLVVTDVTTLVTVRVRKLPEGLWDKEPSNGNTYQNVVRRVEHMFKYISTMKSLWVGMMIELDVPIMPFPFAVSRVMSSRVESRQPWRGLPTTIVGYQGSSHWIHNDLRIIYEEQRRSLREAKVKAKAEHQQLMALLQELGTCTIRGGQRPKSIRGPTNFSRGK